MSGEKLALPTRGNSRALMGTPMRNKKPHLPRCGRPKRAQIQNDCISCRERKSNASTAMIANRAQSWLHRSAMAYGTAPSSHPHKRCEKLNDIADRPKCSPCRVSGKECAYETGEGKTRWAALQRRNRALEEERDEARELLCLVRSLPEAEAGEIFRRVRQDTNSTDLGAFVQQIRDDIDSGIFTVQTQQQLQLQHQLPRVNMGSNTASSAVSLPPLHSMIGSPRTETRTALDRPSIATPEDEEPL